jgi:hypothetical protein
MTVLHLFCFASSKSSNVALRHSPPVHLSNEVGNLLQWMMSPNPVDRPTLEQVMLHDWVVRGEVIPPAEG